MDGHVDLTVYTEYFLPKPYKLKLNYVLLLSSL